MVWGVAFDPVTGTVYASDIVGRLWIAQPTVTQRRWVTP